MLNEKGLGLTKYFFLSAPVFEETEAGEQVIELGGDVPALGAWPDQLQPPPVDLDIGLPQLSSNKTPIKSEFRTGLRDIDLGIRQKIPRIVLEILTFSCPFFCPG